MTGGALTAAAILLAVNGWAILMWRGSVAKAWILHQAGRESWGTWRGSPSYMTTAAPAWAAAADLLLLASVVLSRTGSNGRDLVAWVINGPALIAFALVLSVGGWDRPRWALPPWFRDWKIKRETRGHDANHEIGVICVEQPSVQQAPYVFAQCECDWLSEVRPVTDADWSSAIRQTVNEARRHSTKLKQQIEFPFGRPAAAPRELRGY